MKKEAVRTHGEDEVLRNGGDLEVNDRVKLVVAVVASCGGRTAGEHDPEVESVVELGRAGDATIAR